LEADYVLADAGYDSKTNHRAVKAIDASPVIAPNPRRGKRKKIKHVKLLKTKRYVVEQFNGHVKANVLKGCWIRPRGLVKKASMVTVGLISIDASAMKALIEGEIGLKAVSQYWD
jgi:IS5 family transposase